MYLCTIFVYLLLFEKINYFESERNSISVDLFETNTGLIPCRSYRRDNQVVYILHLVSRSLMNISFSNNYLPSKTLAISIMVSMNQITFYFLSIRFPYRIQTYRQYTYNRVETLVTFEYGDFNRWAVLPTSLNVFIRFRLFQYPIESICFVSFRWNFHTPWIGLSFRLIFLFASTSFNSRGNRVVRPSTRREKKITDSTGFRVLSTFFHCFSALKLGQTCLKTFFFFLTSADESYPNSRKNTTSKRVSEKVFTDSTCSRRVGS